MNIKNLENIQELNLANKKLQRIDKSLVTLKGLQILNLSHNELLEWPSWLCSELPQLTALFLEGNNKIPSIPLTFPCLKNLKTLGFDWFAYVLKDGSCRLDNDVKREYITFTLFMCNEEKNRENQCVYIEVFFNYLIKYKKILTSCPIHVSCELGHSYITKLLFHNYNCNTFNYKGKSALSLAILLVFLMVF
jgi:hypothetical protein